MSEYITNGQTNYGWSLTWDAAGRYPIIAKRRFATLADAQAFVDDTSATATATEGLVLVVFNDSVAKNNGIYYVAAVANTNEEYGPLRDKGVLVKSGGNDTVEADDYADAVELSKTLNAGQLIQVKNEYVENEGEENEVTYQKGFYIVEGSGVISALATTTGADDEVGALKTRVADLETVVGNDDAGLVKDVKDLQSGLTATETSVKEYADGLNTAMDERVKVLEEIDHDAYVEADNALKEELQGEIDKKVSAVEGERLMTDAEGTKLEGIEEGAQVNKIEVVKVNGTALTIGEDKSVDVIVPDAPVQGVAEGENIISLDGDKLKTTLNIVYVPATETENAKLNLQGIGGAVVSSIDATAFVKDGMLSDVKLEEPKEGETGDKYLVLTFNTDAGKQDIRLDVTGLLDYYAAGDGLVLDGKTFKVKVDETVDSYLQVTANGLSVSESLLEKVAELDAAILDEAKKYADGLNTAMDERVKVLEEIDHDAYVEADKALLESADTRYVKLEGFNEFTAEMESKLEGIEEGAQVNSVEGVRVNGIDATLTDDKVAEVKVTAKDIELGAAITGNEDAEIYGAETKISTVLQGIQDSIRSAVAGGVNSVTTADNVIVVNNADANNPKVSLKVEESTEDSVVAGHIELVKGDAGLYGVMYYDGDDAE